MTHAVVVVGAGLFGLTVAERVANDLGKRVLIVERRPHIGGNASSRIDPETGIEIHPHGPHIFHTSNDRVWEYVNRFTAFNGYRHHGWTVHKGETYPLPINLGTINQFFRSSLKPAEARGMIRRQAGGLDAAHARNMEEKAIALVGRPLYEAFIEGYTAKQWQTDPADLPADLISRLPVRYTYDNRYFSDRYEGIPVDGYCAWFERMTDSPLIETALSTDFFDVRDELPRVPIVYTGPIDRFFDYSRGHLGWRTLDLVLETVNVSDYQGTSIMNFADREVRPTRTTEFHHFHPEWTRPTASTVVMHEYSRFADGHDELYYPVNSVRDRSVLREYRRLANDQDEILFGGRLGTYQYLDMHMAIASALSLYEGTLRGLLSG